MRWKDDAVGGGNFVYELSKRLLSSFDVFVLAPRSKNSKKEEVIDDLKVRRFKQFPLINIELTKMGGILSNLKKNKILYFILPFFLLQQFISIARLVKSEKIEIIHAHWIIPQAFIAVLYRKISGAKIKILATIHGSDFLGLSGKFGNKLKKYVFDNIDELTVVSASLKDAVVEFGYKKEIYVYSMGIDTTMFSPDKKNPNLKARFSINGEYLLYVGACTENKGIRYLVEAIPKIVAEYPDLKLLIIGDGVLKTEMISLVEQQNVQDNVLFLGAILNNELPEFYATADIFVMPSLYDGFGLVNIEAMSCGTLPIVSDIPVFREIIEDGKTGVLVELKNSEKLASAVVRYLRNPEENIKMASRCRQDIIGKFDWVIVGNNYRELLLKV